jgi:aryl-alcohol dehydrogenase-like predicted oxidoreductase
MNLFNTADAYANGESEMLLGVSTDHKTFG